MNGTGPRDSGPRSTGPRGTGSRGTGPRGTAVSLRDTNRLIGRALAGFALLMLIQAASSVPGQSAYAAPWWNIIFLGGILLSTVALCLCSIRGPGLEIAAGTLSVLVIVGLALWPAAVCGNMTGNIGAPWLYQMVTLGAAAAAFAFGAPAGYSYAAVIGVVLTLVRIHPPGGSAPRDIALEDALFTTVLGWILTMAISVLRRAAGIVDASAQASLAGYRAVARQRALLEERRRLDALLHDDVMTALVTAAQAGSAQERAASANVARRALQQLEEMFPAPSAVAASAAARSVVTPSAGAASASDSAGDTGGRLQSGPTGAEYGPGPTVADLGRSIRSAIDSFASTAEARASAAESAVRVTLDSDGSAALPHAVVRAVTLAVAEAVRNVLRHAGSSRCDVLISARKRGAGTALAVTVRDDGAGFDPQAVSARRLGIRMSIVDRLESIGGTAVVRSAPGQGTVVHLTWNGAADA